MKTTYTGYLGDLSPEQELVLNKFREYNYSKGITKFNDQYLLRFCRARKFDLPAVVAMWDKFIKWRIDNDVDNIDKFQFTELPLVKQYYAHGYYHNDRTGRPLYIERVGKLDVTKLFQVTTEERLVKYYVQSYEFLLNKIFPSCSAAAGRTVEQTFTILDLDDVSLGMATKVFSFIKLASSIGQDFYPEILGKMFIINAPFLFKGVWAMVRPLLDSKTQDKISIVGSSYRTEITKFVDDANLPTFLGGKCVDDLLTNPGPWVSSGMWGIPLPSPINPLSGAGMVILPPEEYKDNSLGAPLMGGKPLQQ